MKATGLMVCLVFLLTSCFEFQELDFKGMEGIKPIKIEKKNIDLALDVRVCNENFFAIKIKPCFVEVLVEGELIGTAKLNQKVKLIRKKEGLYNVPLQLQLEDKMFFKLVKFALREKVAVRLKGVIKGSVYGIPKKIKIDETIDVAGKYFNFSTLFGK
jgi:LEA14-like dessication related protein